MNCPNCDSNNIRKNGQRTGLNLLLLFPEKSPSAIAIAQILL
ncbi:hypothetical protein [Cylindrospermopsis raciborskii]|nr:hypothetical protein [Cylindrospermopsis raciborskii]